MITEIGIVAGDIWHYLDDHGTVAMGDLIKNLDKPKNLTLMSLGWLAREGHVIIEGQGEDAEISLRKSK